MSWGRIDDRLDDSPKFAGIDPAAAGLWLLCQPQALRRSDGFVPQGVPERFTGRASKRLIAILVARGLWDETEGGWIYHDFDEYSKLHGKRAQAGSKGAKSRWQTDGKPMANDASRDGKSPEPVPVNSVSLRSTERTVGNGSWVGVYVDACRELGVSGGTERIRARVGMEAKRLEGIYGREVIGVALKDLARRGATPSLLENIAQDADRAMNGVQAGRIFPAALRVNSHDARMQAIREGIA